MISQSRIVVSAASTGAGKTLVALALCAVMRDRGLRVHAYKCGPDYVDARLYASILGEPAHNLDAWLDGADGVLRHIATVSADADVIIIEGMMGLFDGDDDGKTSTATIARILDASILTVLDTWTASQSAAAVALGLRAYDSQLRHVGAILNRTGGVSHVRAVTSACDGAGIEVLAAIRHNDDYTFPERGLGLERETFEARASVVERLAEDLATQLDVPALLAASASSPLPVRTIAPANAIRARIAYAQDDAFWFTYPETLDALRTAGAELIAFSPLHDRELPADIGGIWIGGGYPELHGAALEANATMRHSINTAIGDGVAAYAECGGLMYLAQTLQTADGTYAMAGALAGATSIAQPRLHLGYREASVATASPFDGAGALVRAYEFHYATSQLDTSTPAYTYGDTVDGAVRNRCMAAFLHRHFLPGDPALERFVWAAAG